MLLYIKPAVYGREPQDVTRYRDSHPAFPHQSTGDQFFDEPQFEGYRALGSFIMDEICGSGFEPLDLKVVLIKAFERMREACAEKDFSDDFLGWLYDVTGLKGR